MRALGEIVIANPDIKGLALNFTRIGDAGIQCLVKALRPQQWKAIRLHDRRLYSLDLSSNFIHHNGICSLLELFHDPFQLKSASLFEADAPIPTSIRVLTLDYNFIGKVGADALSQILTGSR